MPRAPGCVMAEPAWATRITAQHRAEVERLLRRRDLAPRLRERLEMVKAAALGQGEAEIAACSGRTARSVATWLERFLAGRVAALPDAPRSGRPARRTWPRWRRRWRHRRWS